MKISKFLKASLVTIAALALTLVPVASVSAVTPGSVPYAGAETSGTTFPAFNIFNGVPSVGNEADFIRVKKDGEANSTLRNVVNTDCKTGDRFDVWFYLHNGAKPSLNNNGSGPGVAHNVVAKTTLPKADQAATSFGITGGVTASNAQAISDSATINCGGKQFKMKYVESSANAFLDLPNKVVQLPRAFVEGGTPIGTNLLDGNVWGCWDQRVWMGLKVEVVEVATTTEEPKPSLGECKLLKIETVGDRKVNASITTSVTNATIVGYKINWGDGTTSTKQTDSHEYAKDGTYTITAEVQVQFANGTKEWKTANGCKMVVTFKPGEPPVVTPPETPVTPTVLPATGAASTAGIFALVSVVSSLGYYWYNRRNVKV